MSEQVVDDSARKPEILVVDDSKVIRIAVRKILQDDYVIHLAKDGLVGWEMLQKNNAISVVFTDLIMPNLDGMELLKNIRNASSDNIAELPVIVMTGYDDSEATKQKVFDAGATDFISKPFESIDLLSRAKSYTRLSQKVVELEKKTGYDKLTGLYNANLLEEQGNKAFSFSNRHKLAISAVYFEIEDFQSYFLSFGKKVAQHVIVAVGKRLQEVLREEDIAARVGVAKYVLVLPMTNRSNTEIIIERVRAGINNLVFDTGKEKIRVNFTAGYAAYEVGEEITFSELLERADDALHRATISVVEPVVSFDEAAVVAEEPLVVSEQDVQQAFTHILDGKYYQIPEQHLETVMQRLSPFMEYVENQTESNSPLEDDIDKNIAL